MNTSFSNLRKERANRSVLRWSALPILLALFSVTGACQTPKGSAPEIGDRFTTTFKPATAEENYAFDGNLADLETEIRGEVSGKKFPPNTTAITGVVTVPSRWEYQLSGTDYNHSFFIQDQKAGMLILAADNSLGYARVGDKVRLTVVTALLDGAQPLVSEFEQMEVLESGLSVYAANGNGIQPDQTRINKVHFVEGVVMSDPVLRQDDNFNTKPMESFRGVIRTTGGRYQTFRLGLSLVRGTLDGYTFEFLEETVFNLKKGQRVRLYGPYYRPFLESPFDPPVGTTDLVLAGKSQIEFLGPAEVERPENFSAVWNENKSLVRLSWDIPAGQTRVMLRRSTRGFPDEPLAESDTGDTILYEGAGDLFFDRTVQPGETYQYSLFTRDASGDYSPAARAGVVVSGTAYQNTVDADDNCQVYFTEIGTDPDGTAAGDFNGDGAFSSNGDKYNDEFVELFNKDCPNLDISGWKLRVYNQAYDPTTRHVFPEGSSLGTGEALLVFAGGDPAGRINGVKTQVASTGNLYMTDDPTYVELADGNGRLVTRAEYSSAGATSYFLDPDNPDAGYSLSAGFGGLSGSPGVRDNGGLWPAGNLPRPELSNMGEGVNALSVGSDIVLDFPLDLDATSLSDQVSLFAGETCQGTAIAVSASVSANRLTVDPDENLTAGTLYCLRLGADIAADTSGYQNEDLKLGSDQDFFFAFKPVSGYDLRDVLFEIFTMDDGTTRPVSYLIREAIVTAIDEDGYFYIQQGQGGAGIFVREFGMDASDCDGISLSVGDRIDIQLEELERSAQLVPRISAVTCVLKTGTDQVATPVNINTALPEPQQIGSQVYFTGQLVSADCGSYCTFEFQTAYGVVNAYQADGADPLGAADVGNVYNVRAPLTNFYSDLQIALDPVMGTVEATTDTLAPRLENLKISGESLGQVGWDADTLTLTFSEPMDAASFTTGGLTMSGATVASFDGLSAGNTVATFSLNIPDSPGSLEMTISQDFTDAAGNAIFRSARASREIVDPDNVLRLLISEVGNKVAIGDSGNDTYNDYVELYNPSGVDFPLKGMYIGRDSGCTIQTSWSEYVALPEDIVIPPRSFYLLGRSGGDYNIDFFWSGSIGEGYCVVIASDSAKPTGPEDPQVLDFVAFDDELDGPTTFGEGASSAGDLSDGNALGRLGCGTDTNDNGADFTAVTPDPQNSQSASTTEDNSVCP